MSSTKTTDSKEHASAGSKQDAPGALSSEVVGNPMSETSSDTNSPDQSETTPTTPTTPTPPSSPGRLIAGAVVGAIVATPLAWLLSYGATLPFFLGIFFFALFGLVVGASVYRVASPKKPYGKFAVLFATTALVAYVFTFALVKEGSDLPLDIAKKAAKKTADLGGRSGKEYRADVATEVRAFLSDRYSPGGTMGYIRWALTSGEIPRGTLASVNADLAAPQSKLTFAIRVVLTLALLAFGIGSQTLGLYHHDRKTKKHAAAPSRGL